MYSNTIHTKINEILRVDFISQSHYSGECFLSKLL